MSNPYFQFKQFTVWHNRCAMKVGTDGVLLGAWAEVKNAYKILDIGTGSGLIALMAAQRTTEAQIDAIDIDETAVAQARENVLASPWKERINLFHSFLQTYAIQCTTRYDAIISNPPYFQKSLTSPDHKRTLARHNDTLSSVSLLENSRKLLSDYGILHLILPVEEGEELILQAKQLSLFCVRKTSVHPRADKPAKRLLISLQRHYSPCLETSFAIETTERHVYTDEYIRMTDAFYINM